VIENFVKLRPGVEKKLHFYEHEIVTRVITDPILKMRKKVQSLVFLVDREDGVKVDKMYSIVSEKHAAEFAGYLPGKRYRRFEFVVVKDAPGFVPPRIVEVRPYG